MKNTLILWVFFLISKFPNLAIEDNEWLYKLLQNDVCSNFGRPCKFKISSDYPTSPFISFYFTALDGLYRYYRIKFEFTSGNAQKFFYQETYDASNYESLVLGGDVDIINCTGIKSCTYYIKIKGDSQDSDSFQINFLGLPDNFAISVQIEYPSDIDYYISKDDWKDAIYISEEPWLNNYFKEREKQVELFRKRQIEIVEKATLIMKNLFSDTTFNIKLPKNGVLASEIYVNLNFIATVTLSVSYSITTEKFFQDGEIITSEKKFIKGKLDAETDGIDILGGNAEIDSDIIHIFKLFNQKLEDLMFSAEFENDIYSVSISTSPLCNCIIITIKFFSDIEMLHYTYEMQIKIIPINPGLTAPVTEIQVPKIDTEEILEGGKVVLVTAAITGCVILVATFSGPAFTAIGGAVAAGGAAANAAVGDVATKFVQYIAQLFQSNVIPALSYKY